MRLKRRTFKNLYFNNTYTFFQIKCLILIIALTHHHHNELAQAISIKPADFDRLIMPCYSGYSPNSYSASSYSSSFQPQSPLAQGPYGANSAASYPQSPGRVQPNQANSFSAAAAPPSAGYQSPSYYGSDNSLRSSSSFSLGQQVPRANTIDNFIALVSKIEAANPRLAGNPDQLIRTLLGRFRLDNYYYDVRSRTSISEQDYRITDIIPALLNYTLQQQVQLQPQLYPSYDEFPEHLLEQDEKCSMYFMLSHFIIKETPANPPLASVSVPQLAGPLAGQRPPSLQAAGSGYPAQSASAAFSGTGTRFSGPSPSFGSPATNNMNSFGNGLSNQPEYTGNNPYGTNVLQPNQQYNQNFNNLRNTGQFAGSAANSRYATPFIDGGQSKSRDERQAIEYGVVGVSQQENAAISLNRVLMAILAANIYPQEIKQLAPVVFPNQFLAQTAKLNEDIDPLYAVTLADLWAISAIPKAGKPFDLKMLGDNGHWNSTMCPTSFILERANSIRFTTAELLGGLDGFNLGMVRRDLLSRNRNIRLSDLLRMYYSKTGFRPQFAEYSVCSRGTAINNRLDEIRRQADNYLRLYQLNVPTSDNDLALHIMRLDSFKELLRNAAMQYTPNEICQDSNYNDAYPSDMSSEQCEIGKADVVTVLDTSSQANEPFESLVVNKLAQKIGLSRTGNSLTILTNQQDSTGYAGSYSFNAIVRNSTNTAEIGCALSYDSTRSYQGGQITEPTRLVEMFERALVNLDTEYLIRQNIGPQSSSISSTFSSNSYKPATYISSLFGQSDSNYLMSGLRPKNTAGSKVIIWFNYGSQAKPVSLSSGPTNWQTNTNTEQNQYKFYEAKRYFRENFRSASILAVSSSRDEVKAFVDDEQRDIFTDIPPGSGSSSAASASDYYGSSSSYSSPAQADPSTIAMLNGPADILVTKLVQRMCEIPAVFQYPLCFKAPSENAMSVGFISPKRKQYWMMSPKTFFASRSVRMAFKVDGGRLRVCFGRMVKPDESAAKNPQQNIYQPAPITLGSNQAPPSGPYGSVAQSQATVVSSGNNYYTGLDYGICKDVSPGQEIDFIVDDPCYKKPIVDCQPFYFVIKEITNPGEGDQNYMCKDAGCKRFDQVKFTMTHTGVTCNSAFRSIKSNWLLIMISIITTACLSGNNEVKQLARGLSRRKLSSFLTIASISFFMLIKQAQAQLSAPADFGQGRYGEKRGNFTPSEILAIILLIMTIIAGLAVAIGLCYYVNKRNSRGSSRLGQNDY